MLVLLKFISVYWTLYEFNMHGITFKNILTLLFVPKTKHNTTGSFNMLEKVTYLIVSGCHI